MQAIGMLTSSSHHTDDSLSLASGDWAWNAFRWVGWIGVGLGAWGWYVFQSRCDALLTSPKSLVALKVLLGLSLLSFSALRQAGMEDREAEDVVNDFGRSGVGESKEEKVSLEGETRSNTAAGVQPSDHPTSLAGERRSPRVYIANDCIFPAVAERPQFSRFGLP